MNVQKIIALIAVLAVTLSILNIAVYASDTSTMTSREYINAQSGLIDKYANGDITFTQFQNQSQAVTNEYIAKNTIDGVVAESALTVGNTMTAVTSKMANVVEQYGEDARSYIKDWWDNACKKNNVPTETTQTSNEDYKGYGAVVITADGHYKDYCQYVVIDLSNDKVTLYAPRMRTFKRIDGSFSDGTVSNSDVFFGANALSWKYYGDIRYVDGTPAPTDDVFEYGTIHKFDEMNDKQLIDLLNEFSEELERQNPDLSNIEGLLNAIYARLGTLDSDDDENLLNAINANILALIKADKDKNEKDDETNEQLINTLLDIRDSLKNGTLGTAPEAHGHEISGTVYNVIPMDKNFLNKLFYDKTNLKVQYEGTVYYLEDCGCIKISGKYYTPNMNYNSYELSDYDFSNSNVVIDEKYVDVDFSNYNTLVAGFSASQKKKIDNVVDLMYKMVSQAVPYGVITSSFAPYEGIIFNTSEPQDIVLNFESTDTVGGFSATILSVSFFQNQYVSSAMDIVKPLITVIIGYCWLKVMRRKAVGMLR